MYRKEFLEILKAEKLVVVVRGSSGEAALKTAEACIAGGIKLIEITYTTPNATEVISVLTKKYKDSDIIIGAGTVLDDTMASDAIEHGAEFIVSPDYNVDLNSFCKRNRMMYVPGVFTPSEIASALRKECMVLKLFPGDIARPQGLKALKGPFPNANFMVTGGVSVDNLDEWFQAGAMAVGAGSNLTYKAKNEDYDGVTIDARLWVDKIHNKQD